MKHQHSFKRDGMTLWCKCGLMNTITCAHEWKQDRVDRIEVQVQGGKLEQRREVRICKSCGAIANMNTTTGITSISR